MSIGRLVGCFGGLDNLIDCSDFLGKLGSRLIGLDGLVAGQASVLGLLPGLFVVCP